MCNRSAGEYPGYELECGMMAVLQPDGGFLHP